MVKCLLLSVFVLFGLACSLVGQERKLIVADSILNARGEIFFSFPVSYFTPEVSKIISVKRLDSKVFAYANRQAFKKILDLNIDFELQPGNFFSGLKSGVADPDLVYPSYSAYLQIMQSYGNNPLCELHELGTTVKGRKLLAIKITGKNSVENKPALLIASSIHGNELTGFKMSLWLIDYLLGNYNEDSLFFSLLDESEIWIIPLINPDGTYFGGDNTVSQAKRFNANNLDLNRNFPDPADGQHPDNAARQPETQAIMDFYKQKNIILSAALHTGDELVNYPWDTWPLLHADNDWYRRISRSYVDLAQSKNRGYMTDFDNGIVNGFDWYRVTGGQQDYVNYFLNSREITIELSKTDMPDSASLANYWDLNRESLFNFLKQGLNGIRGQVSHKEKGTFINARIKILNHDNNNSWVYSHQESGWYYRLIAPGSYTVQVTAPGFVPVERNFQLNFPEKLRLDFQLEPITDPVSVYPNPFRQSINLIFGNDQTLSGGIHLSLFDVSGKAIFRQIIQGVSGNMEEINFPLIPDGTYVLEIKSTHFKKQIRLMKMD